MQVWTKLGHAECALMGVYITSLFLANFLCILVLGFLCGMLRVWHVLLFWCEFQRVRESFFLAVARSPGRGCLTLAYLIAYTHFDP